MSPINKNHMMYDSWDMEHSRQIFFSFWTIFCPFTLPLTTQRIKVLKKWLYTILFLRYGVWWMQLLLFILGNFLPFHTPNCPKTKISKKRKKKQCQDISSFYTSLSKIMIIHHTVHEIWHMAHVIFIFHFESFFALLLPNSPKNENFKKVKKTPGDTIILDMCTKSYN